jgi:hypothetical protein
MRHWQLALGLVRFSSVCTAAQRLAQFVAEEEAPDSKRESTTNEVTTTVSCVSINKK